MSEKNELHFLCILTIQVTSGPLLLTPRENILKRKVFLKDRFLSINVLVGTENVDMSVVIKNTMTFRHYFIEPFRVPLLIIHDRSRDIIDIYLRAMIRHVVDKIRRVSNNAMNRPLRNITHSDKTIAKVKPAVFTHKEIPCKFLYENRTFFQPTCMSLLVRHNRGNS
jgi:hypothetical protein